jgi:hypothetical protein
MLSELSSIVDTSKVDRDIAGASRLVIIRLLRLPTRSTIYINPTKADMNHMILRRTHAVVLAEVANDGDILVVTTYGTAQAVNGWRFRSLRYIR